MGRSGHGATTRPISRCIKRSIEDPEGFWAEQAKRIDWIKPFTKVKNTSFSGDVTIKWFEDGTLNASANCLDRHLAKRGHQIAIIWEGDDAKDQRRITYKELHEQTCRHGECPEGAAASRRATGSRSTCR